MKAHFLIIGILAAAVMATNSFAAETAITELSGDFTGSLGKLPRTGKVQVHRITSPAAFKRVIGDRASAVDFAKRDVVIVRGSLGCAHGKVVHAAKKSVVTFRVKITERCSHRTRILHHFPYSAAFSVDKSVRVAPHVQVERKQAIQPRGDLAAKLGDPAATHVNLSGFQLTEDDLARLKAFKNVTHLYLSSTQITDKGLANLAHMDTLYQLFLGGNAGISDAGLKHLSGIMTSRIQILDVNGTAISHEGLAALQKWSKQQDNQQSTQIQHALITPQVHD